MNLSHRIAISIVLAGAVVSALAAGPPADTVYQHGTVYTVDGRGTVAQAVAISAGRIVYVGKDEGAKAWIGPATKVVDLRGRTVLPAAWICSNAI